MYKSVKNIFISQPLSERLPDYYQILLIKKCFNLDLNSEVILTTLRTGRSLGAHGQMKGV